MKGFPTNNHSRYDCLRIWSRFTVTDFPFISLNDVWRRKLPVFWMLGAWIWVFRHLENTQESQNFDRAFQVQEKGETKVEIIKLLKFVPLTTIGPFYCCDFKQILSHRFAARETIITTFTLLKLKWNLRFFETLERLCMALEESEW